MSSSQTSLNPLRIAAIAGGVFATATVSYAIYFDYKRRHDPVFRKKLLKDQQKVAKTSQQQAETGKAVVQAALKRALVLINAQPVPVDAEGKEQYFMEQVAQGEQLAARTPDFYVAAAIAFYKALKVYPAPQELIVIYQKTQPPAIFELIMELISLEMAGLTSSSSDPRDNNSDPLLQEIDDVSPSAASSSSSSNKPKPSSTNEKSTSSGPSSTSSSQGSGTTGSFVVVDDANPSSSSSTNTTAALVIGTSQSGETVELVDGTKHVEVPVVSGATGEDPPEEPIVA